VDFQAMNNPAASSGVSNLWKALKSITASGGEFNAKRLKFLDIFVNGGIFNHISLGILIANLQV
jgi:hypothetical protein